VLQRAAVRCGVLQCDMTVILPGHEIKELCVAVCCSVL